MMFSQVSPGVLRDLVLVAPATHTGWLVLMKDSPLSLWCGPDSIEPSRLKAPAMPCSSTLVGAKGVTISCLGRLAPYEPDSQALGSTICEDQLWDLLWAGSNVRASALE